jgi:hypothetical protein
METHRKSHGLFGKGNRYGKGRPFGSPNKPKEFPFVREGSNSVSAQRFRTVASRMAFDLGGRENLTEAQQQLIRRCAMLSAQCELLESQAVEGQPLDGDAYGRLTGHLVRALSVLGIKREMVDVTPALSQYLEALPADTLDTAETQEPTVADENEG